MYKEERYAVHDEVYAFSELLGKCERLVEECYSTGDIRGYLAQELLH